MLQAKWIDRIFEHMAGLYGSKFADLWGGVDIAQVKTLWAEKLGGFADRPEAIKAALDALDDKPWPPTLPEFLMMCREAAKRCGPKFPALDHKRSAEEDDRSRARVAKIAADLAGKMAGSAG